MTTTHRAGPEGPPDLGVGSPARAYRLVLALDRLGPCQRWLALDEQAQTNHLMYDLRSWVAAYGMERVREALTERAAVRSPHVLAIEDVWSDGDAASLWACSPYLGHQRGLVRLGDLVQTKGGVLSQPEATRAVEQVLGGLSALHAVGAVCGRIDPASILVDRSGTIVLELHAMEATLARADRGYGADDVGDMVRDEVLAAAGLFFRLLTGSAADETRPPASGFLTRQRAQWDRWIDRALDPMGGFATADEAIAALPTFSGVLPPTPATPPSGAALVVARRIRDVIRGAGWRG